MAINEGTAQGRRVWRSMNRDEKASFLAGVPMKEHQTEPRIIALLAERLRPLGVHLTHGLEKGQVDAFVHLASPLELSSLVLPLQVNTSLPPTPRSFVSTETRTLLR